jgi:Arc/MetJ-type ribon-helix-helix transcriptional regulator
MKVKTSVTLSEQLLRQLDERIGAGGNRSEFIEESVRERLTHLRRAARDVEAAQAYARAAADPNVQVESDASLAYQPAWSEVGDAVELTDDVEERLARGTDVDATR